VVFGVISFVSPLHVIFMVNLIIPANWIFFVKNVSVFFK